MGHVYLFIFIFTKSRQIVLQSSCINHVPTNCGYESLLLHILTNV